MRNKLLIATAVVSGLLLVAFGFQASRASRAGRESASRADATTQSSPASLAPMENSIATPADKQIKAAQTVIENRRSEPGGYNLLAAGYMQKARETGDFGFNSKAEAALNRSLEVAPDNFDAVNLQAKLLLTFHRFPEALEAARRAQQMRPRNHDVYGALTDALVELGDYEGAVAATQAMIDLRPETSSYARVSYLRTLHGDTAGAVAAMRMAADSASPQNPESIAWCRVQLGNELMNAGKRDEGEREFDRALFAFPDYHAALAAKAHARLRAGDTDNAVEFYRHAVERVPLPEYAVALGDLYTKLGRAEDAKRQYELVEFIERGGAIGGTYSRQLALFWADHDMRLDEALAVAERERATRRDIYTSDLLAWCLYKKGRFAEAKAASDEALRLGTRDPRLFYHAGMIAHANGDRRNAGKYLQQAFEIDPSFDVLQAEVAQRTLAALKTRTSTSSAPNV